MAGEVRVYDDCSATYEQVSCLDAGAGTRLARTESRSRENMDSPCPRCRSASAAASATHSFASSRRSSTVCIAGAPRY